MEPLRLQLLGRPDCGLCEEMERALLAHPSARRAVVVEHANVDADITWQRRYGQRVPVLLDRWNEVICEGRFDAQRLDAALREHQRSGAVLSRSSK